MRIVLCSECKKWSENPDICEHCENILSRELREQLQAEEKRKNQPVQPPKRPHFIQRSMDYLKNSNNVLLKGIYYILLSIWMLYVGIMLLLMYLVTLLTG